MHPQRRRRLNVILLMLILFILVISLVMYALRQNISLFYSPSQITEQEITTKQMIRLGGLVLPGSVKRDENSLDVNFKITDNQATISVQYTGILPDLFREGQSIVTKGYLQDKDHFKATEVLAKHDEKYMPPEVKDSLVLGNNQSSLTFNESIKKG